MQTSTPCEALNAGLCLEVSYDGYTRIVEVHAVGLSREGRWIMRVWQVAGGSQSGKDFGWKMMRLDEVTSVRLSDQKSMAPRPLYKCNDPEMLGGIKCQV
jgi:hypothetical protein